MYILQSENTGRYYVGSTHDPLLRLERHNAGFTRSTNGRGPWKIVYTEIFPAKSAALIRERAIKNMKSRMYLEKLIEGANH